MPAEQRETVERTGGRQHRPASSRQLDEPGGLPIPQGMFGRECELAALHAAIGGVVDGDSSLLLVSGPPGCGKSTLIAAGLQCQGRSGKVHVAAVSCDPDTQAAPYGALRQALTSVVRQILAADDAEISAWRRRLRRSLGANGQVVVDLIPQLAWLVGPQPALAELAPDAHRNRFQFTVGEFVATLAPVDYPLILALDNLHWADEGSLDLLAALANDPRPRALLIVGAYRTDPASPAGPGGQAVPPALAALEATGIAVQHLPCCRRRAMDRRLRPGLGFARRGRRGRLSRWAS